MRVPKYMRVTLIYSGDRTHIVYSSNFGVFALGYLILDYFGIVYSGYSSRRRWTFVYFGTPHHFFGVICFGKCRILKQSAVEEVRLYPPVFGPFIFIPVTVVSFVFYAPNINLIVFVKYERALLDNYFHRYQII